MTTNFEHFKNEMDFSEDWVIDQQTEDAIIENIRVLMATMSDGPKDLFMLLSRDYSYITLFRKEDSDNLYQSACKVYDFIFKESNLKIKKIFVHQEMIELWTEDNMFALMSGNDFIVEV